MNNNINQKFIDRREDLGLTQREIADMLGVSPKSLSSFERYGTNLRPDTHAELCRVLKLDLYTNVPLESYLGPTSANLVRDLIREVHDLRKAVAALEQHLMNSQRGF